MFRTCLVSLLLLVGCDPGESDPGDAGAIDAGAQVDAGPDTRDAGHDAGALDPLPAPWRREPSFPVGVDHHTTVVLEGPDGAHVWVFGGMQAGPDGQPQTLYDTVWRAPVLADGALGPWESEAPLPLRLAFHAVAVVSRPNGPYVILAGGLSQRDDGGLSGSPYFLGAGLEADGHLGDWGANDVLASPTLHGAAAVGGDRLYLAGGGAGAAGALATVLSMSLAEADFATDRDEVALPAPRTHHVLFERAGELYAVGGFHEPPAAATTVHAATIGPDGVLEPWRDVGTIDVPLWTAASVMTPEGLVMVGGGEGGSLSARVVRYRFATDGTLLPAEDVMELPYPRAHVHQTPLYEGRLYSVGGRRQSAAGQASSADVYSAPLP